MTSCKRVEFKALAVFLVIHFMQKVLFLENDIQQQDQWLTITFNNKGGQGGKGELFATRCVPSHWILIWNERWRSQAEREEGISHSCRGLCGSLTLCYGNIWDDPTESWTAIIQQHLETFGQEKTGSLSVWRWCEENVEVFCPSSHTCKHTILLTQKQADWKRVSSEGKVLDSERSVCV